MTRLFFEMDGVPVPAEDCTWVLSAPCGCHVGFMLGRIAVDAEAAWDEFRPGAQRRRAEKAGYTVGLRRKADADPRDDCPHSPKWGVVPRPEVEGHTWATQTRSVALHLVPLVIEWDSTGHAEDGSEVVAMCRRSRGYVWSTRWYEMDGRGECATCTAYARKLLGSAVTA